MKSIKTALAVIGTATVLFVLIALFSRAIGQTMQPQLHLPTAKGTAGSKYRPFTAGKAVGYGLLIVAGFADGAVEGYEFDGRKSFERKWGKDPHGFWGSQSWRMIYNDGDPNQGKKSAFSYWLGARDFYHTADDLRKYGYISGGLCIGIGGAKQNRKWWHYALDAGIGFGLSAAAKSGGMKWVRR